MLNPELIERAPWHEFYAFFLKGNPPLIVLLLAINTVFFILFVIRRMRGKNSFRPSTAYTVQGLIILANALVIYHADIFKFAKAASTYI
jgi:uncharacterized membrane protein YcaP (DUF421 family)